MKVGLGRLTRYCCAVFWIDFVRSLALKSPPSAAPMSAPSSICERVATLLVRRDVPLMLGLVAELASAGLDAQAATQSIGEALGLPVVMLHELAGWQAMFGALPFAACAERRCALLAVPVSDEAPEAAHGEKAKLVVTDAFDVDLQAWARTRFGAVEVVLASSETFDAWLAQAEAGMTALAALDVTAAAASTRAGNRGGIGQGEAEHLNLRQIGTDDSPAVRLVNSVMYDALKTGASDIHLESVPQGLAVKFRIDGVLTSIRRVESPELAMQAISRIKVMAQLDIAERRVPQDGRLQIGYEQRVIDVRVSIMPSIHGEDAVLRILDREHLAKSLAGLSLAKLGFNGATQAAIQALCLKPHGMLLVTGPTGSGKTTTLYAAIADTHQARDKIITIEDPVEYQLAGVLQIPVNERKGLTFAKGLRSILRHDPDKILVGEIRDAETAAIAVQSALTGHLVFTTVHANSVFDVVGRFDQFGIDSFTFASAVNGVLAQRLVRRLCGHCTVPAQGGELDASQGRTLMAVGCEHCRGTGYAGRFALGEILSFTPALKELIALRASQRELQAEAEQQGWKSLRTLALEAAAQGLTTLDEVDRVAL